MPVTLAQAQVNAQTDVDYAVIDNFRRYSWVWDQIVFDDTATPGTNGGALSYAYTRLTQAAPAAFRKFNQEYVPGQAQRQRFNVDLKPLGGGFTVDRALARIGPSRTNEVTFQMQQVLVSARIRFLQELIRGDVAVDDAGFDGLSKALAATTTERNAPGGVSDWTPVTVITQALAMARLDDLDIWLSSIVPSATGGGDIGAPGALPPGVKAILGNTDSITRLRALARWAAMFNEQKDDLGRKIQTYGDWVLVDMGDLADGSGPIIPITAAGVTDLYAVTFGIDSLHGASPAGVPLVQTFLPNFDQPGALKLGEVEIGPVATCLKNTRAAGVYRGIDVR